MSLLRVENSEQLPRFETLSAVATVHGGGLAPAGKAPPSLQKARH